MKPDPTTHEGDTTIKATTEWETIMEAATEMETSKEVETTTKKNCPAWFTHTSEGCFFVGPEIAKWDEALDACITMGNNINLAVPDTMQVFFQSAFPSAM